MKHLKADEVQYTTRPLTVFEHYLEMQIQLTSNRSPEFFQLWSMLLWSRQNEVLPKNLFADILIDRPGTKSSRICCASVSVSLRRDTRPRRVRSSTLS